MNSEQTLEQLFSGIDLTSKGISFLLNEFISGELNDSQMSAFLIALRMKGETMDEIGGLIQEMRKHMIPFPTADGAIDTCGTGGDGKGTFNISTTVAFVVAGAGVPVAKHGNKAASSLCGSADVLSELGVNINLTPEQAKKVFEKTGMIFLFAPLYHLAMKRIAPIRKELNTRPVFNFLGPFLNPAKVKRQIIGVPSLSIAEKLAQVASLMDYKHVLIVSSDNGLDEISTTGLTTIFEVKGKDMTKELVDPQSLGFKRSSLEEIQGGNIQENAQIIKDILEGKKGFKRDIVVLNSAYALKVAGRVSTIKDGISVAEESIDSSAAKKVLENLAMETQKYAK